MKLSVFVMIVCTVAGCEIDFGGPEGPDGPDRERDDRVCIEVGEECHDTQVCGDWVCENGICTQKCDLGESCEPIIKCEE
jgi:hypothetical protein